MMEELKKNELEKNELKKNELSETETAGVAGGCFDVFDIYLDELMAKEKEKKQTGTHAHETGASGGW